MAEETKKKLDNYKRHPRESYDEVIRRVLENGELPTLDEAFRMADNIKLKKKYSTQEIIRISHEMRNKQW